MLSVEERGMFLANHVDAELMDCCSVLREILVSVVCKSQVEIIPHGA